MHNSPKFSCDGKGLTLWLVAIAALVGGMLAANQLLQPPTAPVLSQSTTRLIPARVLQAFELIDHTGAAFTLERLRGHWSFLFFGYTHCPDICPTTLNTLNALARTIGTLPAPASTPQYVFVSIDPERDTPELLAKFVPYFNPTFIGVTGTASTIDMLTKQLSVMHMKIESDRPDNYLMDHSAALLLIDPQGNLHALMSPPFDTDRMTQDFQKLTAYFEAIQ
jgi:protein SCO1/2